MVISASLQACGVVFPFAMLTSICRSIVTICSGLYLLIGMTRFSSKWILSHSTWYKFRRSGQRGATLKELKELELRNFDVGVGAFFSNMVMFFIILTTAITLNRHKITNIETSRQAAEALRPFAGKFAGTLFTLGIVGVGFLAIPTLAGSAAYAFAETLGWRQGLNKKLRQARWFYALILISTAAGVALDFIGINPVKALYWTAVINGLLAPFLLVAILIVAAAKKLMQNQPSSRLGWVVVAITTIAMFAAGVAMFVV